MYEASLVYSKIKSIENDPPPTKVSSFALNPYLSIILCRILFYFIYFIVVTLICIDYFGFSSNTTM